MKHLAGGHIGMVSPVSTNTGSPTPEARDPRQSDPQPHGLRGTCQSSGDSLRHQCRSVLAPSVGDQYLPESTKLHPSLVSLPPTALASLWPLCGAENVCPQLGGKARSQALCHSHPSHQKILHLTLTFGGGCGRRPLPRRAV
jgi:hypothetical protein